MYVSTLITVILGSILAAGGYKAIWPIFGSANQLLSALALMTIALWLKKSGKNFNMITIPMVFMLIVTLSALVILTINSFENANYILVIFPILLFVLAIVLAIEGGYQIIFKKRYGKIKWIIKEKR